VAASGSPLRRGPVRVSPWGASLRYAAVIILAFVGGYLARGTAPNNPAAPGADGLAGAAPALALRYAAAADRFPEAPTFSHSLLMLARR
jgi:hypothetical protein